MYSPIYKSQTEKSKKEQPPKHTVSANQTSKAGFKYPSETVPKHMEIHYQAAQAIREASARLHANTVPVQSNAAPIQGKFVNSLGEFIPDAFLDFLETYLEDERIDDFRELRTNTDEKMHTSLKEWFHDPERLHTILIEFWRASAAGGISLLHTSPEEDVFPKEDIAPEKDMSPEEEDTFTEEEDTPTEDPVLSNIFLGLECGAFGIRWQSLSLEQKEEIAGRIKECLPVYHEIAGLSAPENINFPFAVHGSYIWHHKKEVPNDVDIIYPPKGKTPYTLSKPLLRGMSCPPENCEVQISGHGGAIDTLLGIHFNPGFLVTENAFSIRWEDISKVVRTLSDVGNQELASKKTAAKGTRKLINVLFLIKYFLTRWHSPALPDFLDAWGNEMQQSNMALTRGAFILQEGINPRWLDIVNSEAKKHETSGAKPADTI